MFVESKEPLYVTSGDNEEFVILLSDNLAEYYQLIKNGIWGVNAVDIGLDHIDVFDFADQLLGLATLDLGPVRVSFALLAFVLYESMDRLIVRGYEVVAPPAAVGELIIGKSRIGQTDYEIEPTELSE